MYRYGKINILLLLITILVSAFCDAYAETSDELDVDVPDHVTTEGILRYVIKVTSPSSAKLSIRYSPNCADLLTII